MPSLPTPGCIAKIRRPCIPQGHIRLKCESICVLYPLVMALLPKNEHPCGSRNCEKRRIWFKISKKKELGMFAADKSDPLVS